jgi:putative phosphoesterase
MRLGIISDIHANRPALETVLDALDEDDIDMLFCAGDIVGYYTWPNEVIELLRDREMTAVKGNHDSGITEPRTRFNSVARQALDWTRDELTDANRSFLAGLPERVREDVDGHDLYMVHGSPRRPLEEYINGSSIGPAFIESCFDEAPDVCIMGHTHHPYSHTVDGTLFLNPGSVGQPRDGDSRASYAVLDLEEMEADHSRLEYDIDTVADAVEEHLPSTLGERLYHGL